MSLDEVGLLDLAAPFKQLEERTQWTWYKLPRWVFRGKKMTTTEKVLLFTLLDLWNSVRCPDWFYASSNDILRWSGLSKTAMLLARKRLVGKCMIEVKVAPKKLAARHHLASQYHLSEDITEKLTRTTTLKDKYSLVGGLEMGQGWSRNGLALG